MARPTHNLTLHGPDRPGIVAAVTGLLAEHGGNIREAQQFNDRLTDRFFMRVAFAVDAVEPFRDAFGTLADELDMSWRLRDASTPKRVLVMVSKFDHCLVDLLYRTRSGELSMDLVGVVSNHAREHLPADLGGAPFHHIPVTKGTKAEAESELLQLVRDTDAELVVLARYMQILSDGLARELGGRCVNIHHSFLPGFKGARPYHQAHRRGVKIIGATAHFVTPDLDEGPIIAQGVEPIDHSDTPDDLVVRGRSIEARVLSTAVRALLEDRVLPNGDRTVVFGG